MTDFALSAPDQATMYAAFKEVGIANGAVRTQGRFEDGTEWALLDYGPRFDGDLYWVILRWNGDLKEMPPIPSEAEIVWRSDGEKAVEYPAGLPRFA